MKQITRLIYIPTLILSNAILLKDSPDTILKQIMSMYTDPNRKSAKDKGNTENNPLWIYHDTFNPDKQWVEEAKEKYRQGQCLCWKPMLTKQHYLEKRVFHIPQFLECE